MPEVPHLPAQFLDSTGKDELEVRVPAADAFLAISAVASKTNVPSDTFDLASKR